MCIRDSGQTVLLPRIMDVFVDPLRNQKAYLLRALYASQVFQSGLCLPASYSVGSEEQAALSLLVAPVVLATIERELPGLRPLFAALFDTPELSTPDQAVSYTHLDVYKRQCYKRARFVGWAVPSRCGST